MKWIGQHIYDLTSRFRNDVFLEDISTGTIASGAHLGLDSNNKIVKAADGGGDLTSIVAGTGLSGTSLTGPIPTLNVDASQTQITGVGTITTGVWQGTTIKTDYIGDDQVTEDKLANTLLAEIDANTAKVTNVATNLSQTTATDTLRINSSDGDNVIIAEASGSIAGVMTVTHHAKLDGIETEATADQTQADINGLAITTVGTIGTGVWNGTAITAAYIAAAQTNITGVGTITTGAWRGTTISSTYLDADTAHLGVTQTFTGAKTFNEDIIGKTTKERWIKNIAYVVNAGTTEYFIPMVGASENTNEANATSAMVMPAAGKLLKAHVRSSIGLGGSSNEVTVKMINWDADESHSSSNDSIMCAVTIDGWAGSTFGEFDFTGTLDSGVGAESAAFTANEMLAVGIKHSAAMSNAKYFVTLVFEMDWAGY
jgi:hypothetical protein